MVEIDMIYNQRASTNQLTNIILNVWYYLSNNKRIWDKITMNLMKGIIINNNQVKMKNRARKI